MDSLLCEALSSSTFRPPPGSHSTKPGCQKTQGSIHRPRVLQTNLSLLPITMILPGDIRVLVCVLVLSHFSIAPYLPTTQCNKIYTACMRLLQLRFSHFPSARSRPVMTTHHPEVNIALRLPQARGLDDGLWWHCLS